MKRRLIRLDTVLSALLLVVLLFGLVNSWNWPQGPRLFLWVFVIPGTLIMMRFLLTRALLHAQKRETIPQVRVEQLGDDVTRKEVTFFLGIFAFFLATWLFGFEVSALLYVFLNLKLRARVSWALSILLTACFAILVVGIMGYILHFRWPDSALRIWLGF